LILLGNKVFGPAEQNPWKMLFQSYIIQWFFWQHCSLLAWAGSDSLGLRYWDLGARSSPSQRCKIEPRCTMGRTRGCARTGRARLS